MDLNIYSTRVMNLAELLVFHSALDNGFKVDSYAETVTRKTMTTK